MGLPWDPANRDAGRREARRMKRGSLCRDSKEGSAVWEFFSIVTGSRMLSSFSACQCQIRRVAPRRWRLAGR
eukprot:1764724-Rhodomonas_salina.2